MPLPAETWNPRPSPAWTAVYQRRGLELFLLIADACAVKARRSRAVRGPDAGGVESHVGRGFQAARERPRP